MIRRTATLAVYLLLTFLSPPGSRLPEWAVGRGVAGLFRRGKL